MEFVDFSLTPAQIKKLADHQTVQLKAEQLQGGPHRLFLKPRKLRRVHTAIGNRTGIRILLDKDEVRNSSLGGGFRDDLKKLHRAIKPALRGAVRTIARTGANYLAPGLGEITDPLVRKIGDITGAYGIKDDMRRFHRAMKPAIRQSLKSVARAAGDHLAPGLGRFADPVVDRIGDVTGAYGLPRAKRPRGRPRKVRVVNGGSFLAAGY